MNRAKRSVFKVALLFALLIFCGVFFFMAQFTEEGCKVQDYCVEVASAKSVSRVAALSSTNIIPKFEIRNSNDLNRAMNDESYNSTVDIDYCSVYEKPLSTFSIDVDAASYSNIRRFIDDSRVPPIDAVRSEEMINYFSYDYPSPKERPFNVITEISKCPWNKEHQLVLVALQGKKIDLDKAPPSNIVFLIDVSGSMDDPLKLPLLQKSFALLVEKLRPIDRVGIVVYAGAAGVVLESTPGSKKKVIHKAIERLSAGGSTAGGEGIKLAYKMAQENFIKGGNNRIVLATDGDFNVGVSSDDEMVKLIEKERESGVFISVLGFGMGNIKDSKLEQIADNGNGHYAYIDNILEAKKVLVNEFGGTMFTIAKDVKIQIEFNPYKVESYRLIGYENRMLADKDFENDAKDAGDLGAGHTVTALYEVIPAKVVENTSEGDELKYQKHAYTDLATTSNEIMTVKLRYKEPDGKQSKLITKNVAWSDGDAVPSQNFRFASSVAAFSLILRESKFKGSADFPMVKKLAKGAIGEDPEGYRYEFLKIVEKCELLTKS
ncbi:MAG: VWA domain-containing protein [Fibrobacteres bacterium]|nr:VWA domain-containing protein [Fibrobacterota bacterium]